MMAIDVIMLTSGMSRWPLSRETASSVQRNLHGSD